MLGVLAKLGTAEMVGQFALGMAIVLPLYRFAHLEMRSVLCTDANREFAFGHYLAVRIATTVLALAVIPVILYLGHYSQTTGLVIIAVALTKTFDFMSDV